MDINKLKFSFTAQLKRYFKSKEYNVVTVLSLAEKIAGQYITCYRTDLAKMISTYIRVFEILYRIKVATTGLDSPFYKVNDLCSVISRYIIKHAMLHPDADRFGDIIQQTMYYNDYEKLKLDFLFHDWKNFRNMINKIQGYESFVILNKKLFNISDFSLQLDHMFEELLEKRKYGIKASVFKDRFVAGDDMYVLPASYLFEKFFSDMKDIQRTDRTTKLHEKVNLASVAFGFDEKNHNMVPMGTGKLKYDGVSITCQYHMNLGFDGKLNMGGTKSYGILTLDDYVSAELYNLYRAILYSRVYDLIVPLYTVQQQPALSSTNFLDKVADRLMKTKEVDPMLILARVRSLFDDKVQIQQKLDEELEESHKRVVKVEHEVIAHIRKLPKGYKASKRAHHLAKELLNYNLKPGETFVSTTIKNKGGKRRDKIHTAKVKRPHDVGGKQKA